MTNSLLQQKNTSRKKKQQQFISKGQLTIKRIYGKYQKRYQQYQQQQQEHFSREGEYFQRSQKRYKKVVYKEEIDSEPEQEESQYATENKIVEQEKQEEQK